MISSTLNWAQKIKEKGAKLIYPPPETDQFQENGKLSPDEFTRAGDKLTEVYKGWKWMASANPDFKSIHLGESKQFLILERCLCKRRVTDAMGGHEEKVTGEDGEDVIILHPKQEKEEEEREEDQRYYTMYITYDEFHFVPRMFFSATDSSLNPLTNDQIRQDIQKEYLDKTLTVQKFQFIPNRMMPTVHPCKHANVLKTMSDAMRENKQKVESHFALFIFLKFITSVIPTVEFDLTGDIHFQ